MVKKSNFLEIIKSKFFQSTTTPNSSNETADPLNRSPFGTSGTDITGGFFDEEFLQKLTGEIAADEYDKMRRQEPYIKMILSAIKNPIKAASWEIQPADDSDEAKRERDFLEFAVFEDIGIADCEDGWKQYIQNALTLVDFGFSVHEIVDKVVIDNPTWGTYNGIAALGWRSQKTICEWNLDNPSGLINYVEQQAFGDLEVNAKIPGQFLIVNTLDKEGDNYEGISILRAAYGPYIRKKLYKKLQAIGIERFAIPMPVGIIPKDKIGSPEETLFAAALSSITSHQKNYLTIPEGWAVDFKANSFDPNKVQGAIDAEDKEITVAALANFLALGMKTSGGSFALGEDLSDFFLKGIQYIGQDIICENVNRRVIRRLTRNNFGAKEKYATLHCTGIADKAGSEFAKVLETLVKGKILVPDDPLEVSIRKRYKLPEKSDEGQRTIETPSAPPPTEGNQDAKEKDKANAKPDPDEIENPEESADRSLSAKNHIRFFATAAARNQITKGAKRVRETMQTELALLSASLIDQVMVNYRKLPEATKINAINDVEAKGKAQYKKKLNDDFFAMSVDALDQAKKEAPPPPKFKFVDDDEKKTMPKTKRKIKKEIQLLVLSQDADLKKAIFFRFGGAIEETDSEKIIRNDLEKAGDKYIASASVVAASGNSAANIVNGTRDVYFNDPEVIKAIESFTFTNPDPVSPICQDLNGRTFKAGDPEADRNKPPLHHNCKSYIVPNLTAGKNNPDISPTGLKPSSPALEKFKTLADHKDKKKKAGSHEKELQALIFDKENFTKDTAIEFAKDNDFKSDHFENTDKFIILRQRDIADFEKDSFEEAVIADGVKANIGKLK